MKKALKIAGIALALLLAAALVVPMAFRGTLGEVVRREANARLAARLDFGSLDLSLLRHFPHASLELKDLTLTGTERFEGDTILAADRISVVVDLMSLFGDEGFEVTKVLLDRPQVHAHKRADGAVNWDVMKPSAEEPEPAEEPEDEAAAPSAFRLAVRDVRITGGALRYDDDSTRMHFASGPLSLRLRGDLAADRTNLALAFGAENMRLESGGVTLLRGADAALEAEVEADLANGRYTLSHNTLRLNAIALTLDGWVDLADPDAVKTELRAGCDRVRFKDVLSLVPAFYTRDFRGLTASGELSLAAWVAGELRGQSLPAFEVSLEVADGMFRYDALPKAVTDIRMKARLAGPGGPLDGVTLDVPTFGFTLAGNTVAASLAVSHPVSDLRFDASVAGRMDLGAVREVYPLDESIGLSGVVTADVTAAGRMSDIEKQRYEALKASGTLVVERMKLRTENLPDVEIRRIAATMTPSVATLGELSVGVGRSDLAANGQLSGYLGYLLRDAPLRGRLYVRSELLALIELTGSMPASEEAPAASEPAAEADTTARTAFVVPRNLDLALTADLGEVRLHRMTLADIRGGVSLRNGAAALDGLSMKALGGTLKASGSYSTAVDPTRPALKLSLDIRNASFERTFDELETVQQLVPLFRKTGGDYSLEMKMAAALDAAMAPDLMSLDAAGVIRSENIRIQNVEAFGKLADALGYDKLRTIESRDVAVRFRIAKGRIATEPFDLRIAGATVNLSGSTGLDQTIDYTARVSLPAEATGGLLSRIDVGIGGTFTAPRITLGVKDAAKEAAKNLLDEQVERLTGHATVEEAVEAQKEKIGAAVEEQKEKLNAELERQAAKLRDEAQRAGRKLVEAAEAQRTKLVEGAKNPLAKIAAEKAGDKLVEEAERQSAKLQQEAEAKIDALMHRE